LICLLEEKVPERIENNEGSIVPADYFAREPKVLFGWLTMDGIGVNGVGNERKGDGLLATKKVRSVVERYGTRLLRFACLQENEERLRGLPQA
jgi:hypothetical protein